MAPTQVLLGLLLSTAAVTQEALVAAVELPPAFPQPKMENVTVVPSLPYFVVDKAIKSREQDLYSYTPPQDGLVKIDTCGSFSSQFGVDTLVKIMERVSGSNSDGAIDENDFMLIAQNDDNNALCSPAGPDFEYDSVLTELLFADVQYLIVVIAHVSFGTGVYDLALADYVPSPPMPPLPPDSSLSSPFVVTSLPFSTSSQLGMVSDVDVFQFSPTQNVSVAIETCGSFNDFNGADTVVEVFRHVPSPSAANDSSSSEFLLSNLVLIKENDDNGNVCHLIGKVGSIFDSALVVDMIANEDYFIHVSSFGYFDDDANSEFQLSMSDVNTFFSPPPSPPPPPPPLIVPDPPHDFIPGDLNHNGGLDKDDTVKIIQKVLGNQHQDIPFQFADVDMDGVLTIFDVVALINIVNGL